MEVDPRFRKEALTENGSRGSRDVGSCKLGKKKRIQLKLNKSS